MKHGDTVDYTTRRRQVPAKRIFRCPACGKLGRRTGPFTLCKDGPPTYVYTHRKTFMGWGWSVEAHDACSVQGEHDGQ